MKNSYKNFIAFFFLLTFLTLRLASFHFFSHLGEHSVTIECEDCQIISVTHKLTLISDDISNEYTKFLVHSVLVLNSLYDYEEPFLKRISTKVFLNKPPPIS